MTTAQDTGFNELVENLVTYLELSSFDRRLRGRGPKLTARKFDGAEPFIDSSVTHDHYEDDYIIWTDARPEDLDSRFDICLAVRNREDPSGVGLQRARAVTADQVRGQVTRFHRHIVEVLIANIDHEGSAWTDRMLLGSNDGLTWRGISQGRASQPDLDAYWSDQICCMHGIAWLRPFFWSVRIGYENGPSIHLPTDPVGAQEVFRLRGIPEGKARRAALRTWITDHWRRSRTDEPSERYVRQHLRGATEFHWNGLRCEIRPSSEDLARAEALRVERGIMRQEGTDRR
jgi:hypothetical protein